MSDPSTNPISGSQSPSHNDPYGKDVLPNKPFSGGGSWSNFEKWLGPQGFKQFQSNLCQSIAQQISHDKEQEQKASRRLRKSETGEDDD